MNDKSELLDQLTIDRSAPDTRGISAWQAFLLALVAAGVGGVAAIWLFAPTATPTPKEPAATPRPATTITATNNAGPDAEKAESTPTASADREILNASGYITARRIATVSSQITGLITDVNVEEGMLVEAGQVLAQLDSAVATVNLRLAEAQLQAQIAAMDNVTANLAEARRVYQRASDLRGKGLASEADLTRASAQVDSLEAQLASASATIEVAKQETERQREHLDDHTVRAPFAGVVTVKNAQTGEIVSPGSAGGGFTRTGICTIVDMDSLEIEVDVNESFIGRVFAGQTVEASLDAYPEWKIPASVIAVIPTADRAKATVKVRIGIGEKDARILPDMGVKVAFLKS
ncbi:MAG: efflux RND transporter periplasmic adaptor subunit [Gammaproteobacteria bacterium]|nr:efflux RND transporter periplasmic adaptor subunit [Gammaproteobacteria bacterium]